MNTQKFMAAQISNGIDQRQLQNDDPELTTLLKEIRKKHEGVQAILVYGSWLRGKRDTMLDFYVLMDNYRSLDSFWQGLMCRLLPPNVYQIHHQTEEYDIRAKYALLTLSRFQHSMRADFHSYFWARFAQPCEVLYARNTAIEASLAETFSQAAASFVKQVVPILLDQFDCRQLWTRGLALTYQCELRTESKNRAASLYEFNPAYYDELTSALAADQVVPITALDENTYSNQSSKISRKLSPAKWWLRRVQGKVLSILRLIKAAFTFNQSLQYLLWKIKRHSGIYIEPTQRQLKHPLIFAWPLLWRLYRQGAFR